MQATRTQNISKINLIILVCMALSTGLLMAMEGTSSTEGEYPVALLQNNTKKRTQSVIIKKETKKRTSAHVSLNISTSHATSLNTQLQNYIDGQIEEKTEKRYLIDLPGNEQIPLTIQTVPEGFVPS